MNQDQRRVQALQDLKILDTPAEERYDRLTRELAEKLHAPLAYISLVDSDRQWLKSKVGDIATEVEREQAFCNQTILQDAPLVVPNAKEDPRFADLDFVTGKTDVSFYAGVPIKDPRGHRIGTVCVADPCPREMDPAEMEELLGVAARVAQEINALPTVFLSYASEDQEWVDRLVRHCEVLKRQGLLDLWHERQIKAGDDWQAEIQQAIERSKAAVLLVSVEFLFSDFLVEEEIPQILQRRDREGLRMFPVLLEECCWESIPWLTEMRLWPGEGRTITDGDDDEIDADLAALAAAVAGSVRDLGRVLQPEEVARTTSERGPDRSPAEPETSPVTSLPELGNSSADPRPNDPPEAAEASAAEPRPGETDASTEAGPQEVPGAPEPAPATPQPPPEEDRGDAAWPDGWEDFGTFRARRVLSKGCSGWLLQAADRRLGRSVAIRTVAPERRGDPEARAGLEREAKILASVRHPNVASLYSLEERDGGPYLVLEELGGETLAARLERGPLAAEEASRLGLRIAKALGATHAQGILLRSLRPSGVMVSENGNLRVHDFGLARALGPEDDAFDEISLLDEGGLSIGEAGYSSPERLRGLKVDRRTDVWSLGCILFAMLTGRSPFQADTLVDTLAAVVTREPEWNQLPAEAAPGMQAVLAKCLERDLERRYASVEEVAAALERSALLH